MYRFRVLLILPALLLFGAGCDDGSTDAPRASSTITSSTAVAASSTSGPTSTSAPVETSSTMVMRAAPEARSTPSREQLALTGGITTLFVIVSVVLILLGVALVLWRA